MTYVPSKENIEGMQKTYNEKMLEMAAKRKQMQDAMEDIIMYGTPTIMKSLEQINNEN